MSTPSKKDLFGSVRLDELIKVSAATTSNDNDTLIPYSARVRFSTLQRLKQAVHHGGAFEQDLLDQLLNLALDTLPESNMPLPAAKLAALRNKLRGK